MTLCHENHDDVCYECSKCPVCERIKEIDRLDARVSELEGEVQDITAQRDDLDEAVRAAGG